MRIILLENIKGLGQMGDIKEVKDGYARNFLIPKKMAILATKDALKKLDELKKKREESIKEELEKMKEIRERLKDFKLEIIVPADQTGTIYGSLSSKDISDELKKLGMDVQPEYLKTGTIKKIGEYKILFEYSPEIKTEFALNVLEEKNRG